MLNYKTTKEDIRRGNKAQILNIVNKIEGLVDELEQNELPKADILDYKIHQNKDLAQLNISDTIYILLRSNKPDFYTFKGFKGILKNKILVYSQSEKKLQKIPLKNILIIEKVRN